MQIESRQYVDTDLDLQRRTLLCQQQSTNGFKRGELRRSPLPIFHTRDARRVIPVRVNQSFPAYV